MNIMSEFHNFIFIFDLTHRKSDHVCQDACEVPFLFLTAMEFCHKEDPLTFNRIYANYFTVFRITLLVLNTDSFYSCLSSISLI